MQAPERIVYSVKITNSSTKQSATGDVVDTLPVGVKVVAGTIPDGGSPQRRQEEDHLDGRLVGGWRVEDLHLRGRA